MPDYVYSIANDFPGGQFTGAISDRLNALINQEIPGDPLLNIGSDGVSVTITFQNSLTPAEKTILDGDQSNPAGGLIAKSTQFFDVVVGGNVIPDGETIQQVANGILSTTVTLQLKNGFGTPIGGSGQDPIDIDPNQLSPLTATSGVFGPADGQFSTIVGPTVLRGIVTLEIHSGSLPSRTLNVEFA